jgi:hypothetical protein
MITVILFLIGWVSGVTLVILSYVTREKLIINLSQNYPHIKMDLGFNELHSGSRLLGISYLIKSIISFGSHKNTRLFWSTFINIEAIDNLKDITPKLLLARLINLTSIFIKIFLGLIIIWVIGFLYNI